MSGEQAILIFFVSHIAISIVLSVFVHMGILHLPQRHLLLAVLVPLWGGIMITLAEVYTKSNKAGDRQNELPKLEDLKSSLIQRPILPEESVKNRVIPLEEALMLEDPAIRRRLILEIVQEDPKHYISLLKKVRLGEDPEVSHYASTAIMQVQRVYETDLRLKEQHMKQHKNNEDFTQDYLDTVLEYINSGLLADNAVAAQRKKLNTTYVKLLTDQEGTKELYHNTIDNLIELNDFTAARSLLLEADKRWKYDEDMLLLKLKLSHKTKDRYTMRKELQSLKNSGMYLSPKAREVINFWDSHYND